MDIEERFWAKVIEDEKGCFLWTAGRTGSGKPAFTDHGRRTVSARRWIYEWLNGPMPSDLLLRNLCKNRRCVNPDHQEIATAQEIAQSRPIKDMDERFWKKVRLENEIFPENGCMIWTAGMNELGYGIFSENRKLILAVRWIYERLRGPIRAGLQLDHLCRVRACVNPDHVEPVLPRENVLRSPIAVTAIKARQTHCVNGHAFTEENTYWWKGRKRKCRICNTVRQRRYSASKK